MAYPFFEFTSEVAELLSADSDPSPPCVPGIRIDRTIVHPGVLTNNPKTGNVTATDLHDLRRLPGMPRISRADVPDFLHDAATHSS